MAQPPAPPAPADEYIVLKARPGTVISDVIGIIEAPTTKVPVYEVDEANLPHVLASYGVNHLAGIAGTQDRTVKLSERSDVCCPAHGFTLKPDACRSCALLAGEVQPEPRPQPPA